MNHPDLLIDVSRLIWRAWKGRLPTGIDRVCLAYLDHFGDRAHAVIQWRGQFRVLSVTQSRLLAALLLRGGPGFRLALVRMLPRLMLAASRRIARPGMLYLNIGHTGLESPELPKWVAANRIKAVYLIHDLIPLSHPEFCRPGEGSKHELRMRHALASAAGIIGNSRATLAELVNFANSAKLALPSQIDAWISGHTIPERMARVATQRPYFVTVGTIEGRKNHILLLNVWQRLVAKLGTDAPRLLIIGQRGWEAELALSIIDTVTALKGHVAELGDCDDVDLARLITGARALLMPSFAEGFGLPVVEALQLGTPVVASDLPVFREIAGGIPTFLDPTDSSGWEQQIMAFVGDCPERERQLIAMANFRAPGWAEHFARIEPWLETL